MAKATKGPRRPRIRTTVAAAPRVVHHIHHAAPSMHALRAPRVAPLRPMGIAPRPIAPMVRPMAPMIRPAIAPSAAPIRPLAPPFGTPPVVGGAGIAPVAPPVGPVAPRAPLPGPMGFPRGPIRRF